MITFLLILGGLIIFNFILLKFSVQSIDANKKDTKNSDLSKTIVDKKIKVSSKAA